MDDSQYPANNLRKYILLGFLALFIFEGLYLLFTHSIVIIKTSPSISGANLYFSQLGQDTSSETKPGLHIVRTGDYILSARKGVSMSKRPFHIGALQVKKIGINLSPQKQAFKIASGAEQCPFGSTADMKRGTLLSYNSYDCRELSGAFINAFTKRSTKKPLISQEYGIDATQVSPFKDGVVGVVGGRFGGIGLLFINKGNFQSIDISPYVKDTNTSHYMLSVQNGKIYLFNTVRKTLFTFKDIKSKPTQMKLGLENNDSGAKVRQFQVAGDKIYIISASANKTRTEKLNKGNLYIYNISGDLENTVNLDKYISRFVGFSALNKTTFISKPIGANGYVFKLKDNKLSLYDTLFGVDQIVSAGSSAYALIDGDIYQYQPNGTETLVFHSQNINISSLRAVGSTLLFNGQLTSGDNPINLTYMLTGQPLKGQFREENYLPYSPTPLVSWMDYLGNKVTFAPQLSSLTLRGPDNTPSYSQTEYKYKSGEIKQELKADGFTEGKYQITSYPY